MDRHCTGRAAPTAPVTGSLQDIAGSDVAVRDDPCPSSCMQVVRLRASRKTCICSHQASTRFTDHFFRPPLTFRYKEGGRYLLCTSYHLPFTFTLAAHQLLESLVIRKVPHRDNELIPPVCFWPPAPLASIRQSTLRCIPSYVCLLRQSD